MELELATLRKQQVKMDKIALNLECAPPGRQQPRSLEAAAGHVSARRSDGRQQLPLQGVNADERVDGQGEDRDRRDAHAKIDQMRASSAKPTEDIEENSSKTANSQKFFVEAAAGS
eukprot:7298745-Heterocapsa_arctica.AAC.1